MKVWSAKWHCLSITCIVSFSLRYSRSSLRGSRYQYMKVFFLPIGVLANTGSVELSSVHTQECAKSIWTGDRFQRVCLHVCVENA